jgi:hypothetical protein
MATLTLSNQAAAKSAVEPALAQLDSLLESRRAVWERLPPEKRKGWIDKGLDPVITLAWAHYRYLKSFFKEVDRE